MGPSLSLGEPSSQKCGLGGPQASYCLYCSPFPWENVTEHRVVVPRTSPVVFLHPSLPQLSNGIWNGSLGKGGSLKPPAALQETQEGKVARSRAPEVGHFLEKCSVFSLPPHMGPSLSLGEPSSQKCGLGGPQASCCLYCSPFPWENVTEHRVVVPR
ncbi:Protein Ahnak2 [Manis pentadactyla]|nr:Protein Ahnak2 [Manis pentadactyla]